MQTDLQRPHHYRSVLVGVVILFIIGAFCAGWLLKRGDTTKNNEVTAQTSSDEVRNGSGTGVQSLVSYTLPDGWKEGSCQSAPETIYLSPNGSALDCNANPSAPVSLSVDEQNTTDCQQLNDVENVKKHVCISLFIDGFKSLKASTEYPQSSSYSEDTTFSRYYISTNKGVVKVSYTYSVNNSYQAIFDQLATSINVR